MFLHVRKTLFFMSFLILFGTCFGIDFWWLWLSISASFRNRFVFVFSLGIFCLMQCLLYIFRFYTIFDPKMDPKTSATRLAASGVPPWFSCTLVILTNVRPSSVISRVFLISKFSSRFSCTFVSIANVKPTSVLWPETKKAYRREALDSDSSKDLFESNFSLFGHLFVTFSCFL